MPRSSRKPKPKVRKSRPSPMPVAYVSGGCYYVAARDIRQYDDRFHTVEEAVQHGKTMMESQGRSEIIIVKMVRVVRCVPSPVIQVSRVS